MLSLTQTQIAAFQRCKRLYYLNSVRQLTWPAEERDNTALEDGNQFHLLVQQYLSGLPRESLHIEVQREKVRQCFEAFLQADPLKGCRVLAAEQEISALEGDILWRGKPDVLAYRENKLLIYDWKTGVNPAKRDSFRDSPQTRLYRFLTVRCGLRLLGEPVRPEQLEMVYWFPEFSDRPLCLPYTTAAYEEDLSWLRTLGREMAFEAEAAYPRTKQQERCAYCGYQSYCMPDGDLPELPDSASFEPWQESFAFEDLPGDEDREEVFF